MSKAAFDKITEGLTDVLEIAGGSKEAARQRAVSGVRASQIFSRKHMSPSTHGRPRSERPRCGAAAMNRVFEEMAL